MTRSSEKILEFVGGIHHDASEAISNGQAGEWQISADTSYKLSYIDVLSVRPTRLCFVFRWCYQLIFFLTELVCGPKRALTGTRIETIYTILMPNEAISKGTTDAEVCVSMTVSFYTYHTYCMFNAVDKVATDRVYYCSAKALGFNTLSTLLLSAS